MNEVNVIKREEHKRGFLELYAKKSCNITATAKAIGVGRTTIWLWRKEDEDFDAAIKEIEEGLVDYAESALYRAAIGSEEQPSHITALIFWLCNRRPDRWKHVNRVEIGGQIDHNLTVTAGLSDEERVTAYKRLAEGGLLNRFAGQN